MKYKYIFIIILIMIVGVGGCIWQEQSTQPNKSTNSENSKLPNEQNSKLSDENNIVYQQIKFITVGDVHIKESNKTSTRGNERLKKVVEYINNSDVDFAVFLGDIGDAGQAKQYDIFKSILKNLNKPYYTVAGNHDLKYCAPSPNGTLAKGCVRNQALMYEKYFGPQVRVENYKDYQLIFPGIKGHYRYENGKYIEDHFDWLLDFNDISINRTKHTIVFMHGVIKPSPPDSCSNWQPGFTEYGVTMIPYLEQFPNLIASYSGHVHLNTEQTFDTGKSKAVKYITNGALVDSKGAGGDNCSGIASTYIGYSIIKDGKLDYKLVSYDDVMGDYE